MSSLALGSLQKNRLALSTRQVSTLRYIAASNMTLDDMRGAHQITVRSLLERKYLVVSNGFVRLSDIGNAVIQMFDAVQLSARKHEDDLSTRVLRLLKAAQFRGNQKRGRQAA